ncbi:hypothetical protein P152DRAFT_459879 [Eremomyces bilateralis CBS 781.70]|uniref:Uncharacterized protein n=1 Tax=Eremomyces bilateralis CBS 781.70 TaxID=1392243 RepID=A0A6G1FYQ9_9PEZI|nr:uncharacterized protein P152DRAFT_459879 [Eremomyces bilateralis CBS 781.70]KAF1811005.1 hypothetical protein P152DRAFT_459879 [Eremomyces bilateralis CBS 781.70]
MRCSPVVVMLVLDENCLSSVPVRERPVCGSQLPVFFVGSRGGPSSFIKLTEFR